MEAKKESVAEEGPDSDSDAGSQPSGSKGPADAPVEVASPSPPPPLPPPPDPPADLPLPEPELGLALVAVGVNDVAQVSGWMFSAQSTDVGASEGWGKARRFRFRRHAQICDHLPDFQILQNSISKICTCVWNPLSGPSLVLVHSGATLSNNV